MKNTLVSLIFTIQNRVGCPTTETAFVTPCDNETASLKENDIIECEIDGKPAGDFRVVHVCRGMDITTIPNTTIPLIRYLIRSTKI